MNEELLDIVLARPHLTEAAVRHPAISSVIELGHDVSIVPIGAAGPVNRELANELVRFCEPEKVRTRMGETRGPIRYAFVRRLRGVNVDWNFDSDGRLTAAIAISRLAHPTSVGLEWSARLSVTPEGQMDEGVAGHLKGPAAFAFVTPGSRDWLTEPDANAVASVFGAYMAQVGTLPARVERAIWRHEYAARLEELDVRWLIAASGLEALLKIRYHRGVRGVGSTLQFKKRTVALAAQVGVAWTETDAERAYELRSEMAHGEKVSHSNPDLPLYIAMEGLLRAALSKSLLEPSFQALFNSDAAVEAAFPV